jgi:hypothetical protein
VGITIRIIRGIITAVMCMKMRIIIVTIGFTISVYITIQITTLKRTVKSRLTVVGKVGILMHEWAHKLFFTHTAA